MISRCLITANREGDEQDAIEKCPSLEWGYVQFVRERDELFESKKTNDGFIAGMRFYSKVCAQNIWRAFRNRTAIESGFGVGANSKYNLGKGF